MKIIVTGGRNFLDAVFVRCVLDELHVEHPITLVIEGGALGADRHARLWAKFNLVDVHIEMAEWWRYGKHAGRVRNCKMLRDHKHELDAVVAFSGGVGTHHMIGISEAAGVPVIQTWEQDSLSRFFASYKPRLEPESTR